MARRLWEGFKEARQGLHNVSNPEPCQALLIACAQTYQMEPALAALAEITQAGEPAVCNQLSSNLLSHSLALRKCLDRESKNTK